MTKKQKLKVFNKINKNTLMDFIDIEYIDIGDDYLQAKMPVTEKVFQPEKLLHGGASVAFAESVGSAASHIYINTLTHAGRGIEISANHIKSVKSGYVFARATPLHIGRTTHLWEIKITDESNNLVSHCKLTNIIIEKK
jgi:uncharacterized protein (TIGR00369 family)